MSMTNWRTIRGMAWWRRRSEGPQDLTLSVSDPAVAGWFGLGRNYAGVDVSESTALGLSAVWRAVSLISGTVASLPLRSLREPAEGQRERVGSIFDEPDGPDGQTRFEWVETMLAHLLLHGRAHALKVRNQAGAVVRLCWFHPLTVSVELPTADERPVGGLWFRLALADGTSVRYDQTDVLYVPALSTAHGIGISPISVARNSLGTAVAADRSAAKMFSNGATISGLVTPEEDLEGDEAKQIRAELDKSLAGWENAGAIAVVNRRLKFSPWTMTASDAQFIESRQFQIEEIARWFGVPPHALMQTDKQTSWGSGVAEQNRGLARTVLAPWATRIEQRLSRLLPRPRFVEFDFAGLERPSPENEIDLLIKQVQAGLLTLNEARAIRNLPPIEEPAPVEQSTPDEGGEGAPAAE